MNSLFLDPKYYVEVKKNLFEVGSSRRELFSRNNKSIYYKSLILRYNRKCSASPPCLQRAVLYGRSPAVKRERESAILLLTPKSYRVLGWGGVRSVRVYVRVSRARMFTLVGRAI